MSPVNSSRIGAFFVCLALITTRSFAAYIPEDEVSQQSSHVLKRAYMGLKLMCLAHPRNCPDGFRKRNYLQSIETPNTYQNPESVVKQLENIIKWRHAVLRRRQADRSRQARLLQMLREEGVSKRK